ncbi:hypothetical protein V3C99_017698 [Haemonchus contortus]
MMCRIISILAALTVATTSLPSTTNSGSLTTWRAKRQCFMGRCGTTPMCTVCPSCCSDSPPMVMEMPPPKSCCASPRPSPTCCQAPAPLPPPPPPPVVSTVQCCRAAPAPLNPCCQALAAPQPASEQEQCCLAAPSPNNICCREMAPIQQPAPPPCRCGARMNEMECPGCISYRPRCNPIAVSCRLAFRVRRDAHYKMLSHLSENSL